MHHALEFGKSLGCGHAVIHVVNVRDDILAWYKRVGFVPTGEVTPFPSDAGSSKPLVELHLITLKRPLN